MDRPILSGYMALESWAEDFSEWDGAITGPINPQGANRFWEDPIPMIEKRAYDRIYSALEALTNAALAGLKPLPSQIEEAFNALKEHSEKDSRDV